MEIFKNISKRKFAALAIFTILALILSQINYSYVWGANNQSFTLLEFIGPLSSGLLGTVFGALSVLFVKITAYLISGKPLGFVDLIRLSPMVLAAVYFGSKNRLTAIPAIACTVLFWLHPIGAQVWFFALYWIIPVAAVFFKDNLFARSLGSTFTAHAVGSVAFLYAFNLPAQMWIALIPIVAVERLVFASGMTVTYCAINSFLDAVFAKGAARFVNIEKKYAFLTARV